MATQPINPEATAAPPGAKPRSVPAGRLPELLAPAGDWDCARAAVENGADAIYFGLEKFNARMRAHNFTVSDLPKLMEFLHRRGVKGYVTFNTLIFQNEMAEAGELLRAVIAAGADAAIVQDAGICRLIRRLSPDFPIHASTQMTVTSAAGVAFARELGCNLVVLARECSIKEIGRMTDAALPAGAASLPLEVFVHGALCVAYSGQCLTSEALGGRSANRGECAQACRMPYELLCDGQPVPLGDRKYLLSPQDLAGVDVLPELVRAGVASFKIEGRLKSPEYVASITRVYRQALDECGARSVECGTGETPAASKLTPHSALRTPHYEMEMAFSRGLFTGWFRGIDNQSLVHARFGKKRGVYLGEVARVLRDAVVLRLEGPLKPGDGVVFDAGHPEEKEEGGRVYEIEEAAFNQRLEPAVALRFGHGDIDFSRIHAGDKLWKTDDPELNRRVRATFEGDQPRHTRPIRLEIHGQAGTPLTLLARDELGHVAEAKSSKALAPAATAPLTTARLREQLGRLGGTPFRLGELDNRLEGAVILPVSELNRLRREAVAELERQRTRPKPWQLDCPLPIAHCPLPDSGCELPVGNRKSPIGNDPASAELVVLVRSLAQLDATLDSGVDTIYCELEDPKRYREAVARVRARPAAPGRPACAIFVAPPRITKTGEDWILKQVRDCDADGYLVRNYDHLSWFAGCRRIGDFSLNVANALAADHFKNRFGLERVTASYDLNTAQLEALLRAAPPEWFEITIHQHMPLFHMEHCVFCAFLSQGTDYTNCGRPCDRHEVRLRDRVGAEHTLKADAGCRNTLFHARAQTGAESAARLLALGARRFRVEFVGESPEQVQQTVARYRALLRGEITGDDLWRELKLLNQLGVTRGAMDWE